MKTFPIMLDIRDKLAVVIGAGQVGLRKVDALLAAGARVRLVASAITPPPAARNLEAATALYDPSHLDGACLVFACTSDRAINAKIAADARKRGVLVNAADQPDDCDFHMPAVVRDGDIVLAVASGAAAPGLAAFLSHHLAAHLPPKIGMFAAALSDLRDQLKTALPPGPARMNIMKQLSTDAGYALFIAGGPEALRLRFDELLTSAQRQSES